MLVASSDGLRVGDDALLCLHPDDLEPIEPSDRGRYEQTLTGRLDQVICQGDLVSLDVDLGGRDMIRVHATGPRRFHATRSPP